MFYVLSSLTDPTDPFLTKYMKNKLGESRLACLDNAPTLRDHVKMVGEVPAIKKWIETRPGNDKEEF